MGERGDKKFYYIYNNFFMNIGETEEGVCKSVSVIVSGVCEPKGVPKNTCLVYVVATSVRISSVIS